MVYNYPQKKIKLNFRRSTAIGTMILQFGSHFVVIRITRSQGKHTSLTITDDNNEHLCKKGFSDEVMDNRVRKFTKVPK